MCPSSPSQTDRDPAGKCRLVLYGRAYCHLCDDMLAAVLPIAAEHGLTASFVDVDTDEALEAQLGDFVPVLLLDGAEVCHYHLDTARLRAMLAAGRASPLVE